MPRAGAPESTSRAMWRIYAPRGAGCAIVLPYAQLRDSLHDPSLYIGNVRYVDFEREHVGLENIGGFRGIGLTALLWTSASSSL